MKKVLILFSGENDKRVFLKCINFFNCNHKSEVRKGRRVLKNNICSMGSINTQCRNFFLDLIFNPVSSYNNNEGGLWKTTHKLSLLQLVET